MDVTKWAIEKQWDSSTRFGMSSWPDFSVTVMYVNVGHVHVEGGENNTQTSALALRPTLHANVSVLK